MSIDRARQLIEVDIQWLQTAGLINEHRQLKDIEYKLLMSGKLDVPVNVEIQILRRLERLTDLSHKIRHPEVVGSSNGKALP